MNAEVPKPEPRRRDRTTLLKPTRLTLNPPHSLEDLIPAERLIEQDEAIRAHDRRQVAVVRRGSHYLPWD